MAQGKRPKKSSDKSGKRAGGT